MQDVNVGVIGLGNVGSGTLAILAENAEAIAHKLGFRLVVRAVCSPSVHAKQLPEALAAARRTTDWREVVADPEIHVITELVGGSGVAAEIVEAAIAAGKSVVTANKELLAKRGPELCACAAEAGVNLAMEASVASGIPIHTVLREGIAGDRVTTLYGILNGTSNYILTEIERHGTPFESVLAEAQRLGFAEADPSADIDGIDARSKLAILATLAFGEKISAEGIYTEGIRRLEPIDFQYAHRLGHTIRLICVARASDDGLLLSVRPALIPESTILASVQGAYNAVWVRGLYGADTFYYGRGAGPLPTGVAVVSDLMRVAREIRAGSAGRVPPLGHMRLHEHAPIPITAQRRAWYLRFKVKDRPGIIAALSSILADRHISLDAVLQLPSDTKQNLPFVITLEPTPEASVRDAVAQMAGLDFLIEPPLALPMETSL